MAREVRYNSLGTFEFLVDATRGEGENAAFAFIEANPRLQVEHTVTEEVTGIDIVKTQLLLASGKRSPSLHLTQEDIPQPRGFAIQARINMESMGADGTAKPSGGTLTAFEMPSGPGVRVDTFGYAGYTTNPNFDSLLAKLITHSPSGDFSADAVDRDLSRPVRVQDRGRAGQHSVFCRVCCAIPSSSAMTVYTRFIEDNMPRSWSDPIMVRRTRLFFDRPPQRLDSCAPAEPLAGVKLDPAIRSRCSIMANRKARQWRRSTLTLRSRNLAACERHRRARGYGRSCSADARHYRLARCARGR